MVALIVYPIELLILIRAVYAFLINMTRKQIIVFIKIINSSFWRYVLILLSKIVFFAISLNEKGYIFLFGRLTCSILNKYSFMSCKNAYFGFFCIIKYII